MLGRKMSREAWIVQQERRAKRIRVQRVTQRNRTNQRAILEVPAAKLQSEPKRETEESDPMIKTLPNFAHTDMVFPRTTFPCHENSPLHVSPVTDISKRFRNNPLSSFNGDFTGKSNLGLAMKRARTEDVYVKPEMAKKRCFESFFPGKEEISEADFQMALLKRSISRKKEWVYSQVLQNLELTTPSDTNRVNVISDSQRGGAKKYQQSKTNTPFVNSFPVAAHQSSFSGLVRVKDSKKVIDEDGNCYIDTDDYMSFNRNKGSSCSQGVGYSRNNTFNGHIKQETKDFDSCNTSAVPKRGLFLNLKVNGGVAIDHDSMPKIAAIYTHGINKGRREHDAAQLRQCHVQAKMTGSIYRPTHSGDIKEEMTEEKNNIVKEESKWWPPSPESMPTDVMSRDSGEGLLKVMTPDDMKAYGLPKKEEKIEAKAEEEDDDVVVTKIKMAPSNKHRNNKMEEGSNEKTQDEFPALQLDAYGKAANYKEILLHYISQKLKNDSKNTCLENINSVAKRPCRNMSMEELCSKLKDTREKLEKEQLTWRRKLLSSLEVVLIKKIRRLENESGDVVPDGIILEGVAIKKCQEDTKKEGKKEGSVKGSNNDIVAMMEDLTSETVESTLCKKRTERNSQSVSQIRGYESS